MLPLISICVPTYGEPELLRRCLQSIAEQNYPNIEVIVSDDTPDERVKIVCNAFKERLKLNYFHNHPALGSPANWNAALQKARGDLLLLLHHDDWLTTNTSIDKFAKPFIDHLSIDAVFGSTESENSRGFIRVQEVNLKKLQRHPENLLLANKIGPPSNLMVRSSVAARYNLAYRWLVDIDYYIQALLSGSKFYYIQEKLISVGIHVNQTTNIFRQNPKLVLKENVFFAKSYHSRFASWKIYDHYWRLVRNTRPYLKKLEDLEMSENEIPEFIRHIFIVQEKFPGKILSVGPLSKIIMLFSYSTKGFS